MDKESFKKVEKILYNYKYKKIYVEGQMELKEHLENKEVGAVKAVCSDAIKTSQSYNFNSTVENEIGNIYKKIDEIDIDIYTSNRNNRIVEKTLEVIKPVHRDLFEYKYVQELTLDEISDKMHFTKQHIITLRKELVSKMGMALLGSE